MLDHSSIGVYTPRSLATDGGLKKVGAALDHQAMDGGLKKVHHSEMVHI